MPMPSLRWLATCQTKAARCWKLAQAAARCGEATALAIDGQEISFADLDQLFQARSDLSGHSPQTHYLPKPVQLNRIPAPTRMFSESLSTVYVAVPVGLPAGSVVAPAKLRVRSLTSHKNRLSA